MEFDTVWNAITGLGDAAVIAPLAIIFAALLWIAGDRRTAAVWWFSFCAGALLVVVTQAAFAGWGIGVRRLDFTGLSGHAMGAASVFPLAGYLIGSRYGAVAAFSSAVCGGALAVCVAISRVALGDHSWSEVILGGALGAAVAIAAIAAAKSPRLGLPVYLAPALLAVMLTSAAHGEKAPSHRLVVAVALHLSGRTVPFERWTDD